MKSIYASKLYQASKRKERIQSALIAPNNLSLVQQLAEDLDEEYQVPENLGEEEEKAPEAESNELDEEFDDLMVDDEIDPEHDLVTMDDLGTMKKPSSSSPAPAPAKKPDADKAPDKPKADTSDLMPDSPMTEEAPKPTEASTQVEARTIADLNILKGTLNSRQETAGVIRIAEKENETWIYYNDDVNLNDIMVDVIEYLTTGDYQQLEFNRLARSDNAIVFVTTVSTPEELESIDPEETKES